MTSNTVDNLEVELDLETSKLDKELKSTLTRFQTFSGRAAQSLKNVAASAAALTTAVAATGGAVAFHLKGVIDNLDETRKSAQALGIATEHLHAMRHAAELSGVAAEELDAAYRTLSRGLIETAGKGTGPTAEALAALGISARTASGEVKSVDTILNEVSDKFAGYADGASKTALAMALLGESGAKLIPLLNSGADGIASLTSEARSLGIVLDDATSRRAEAFNDTLTRISATGSALTRRIAADLLPTLQLVASDFEAATKDTRLLNDAMKVLTFTLKVAVSGFIVLSSGLRQVIQLTSAAGKVVKSVADGEFTEAWETLKDLPEQTVANYEAAFERISNIWKEAAANAPEITLPGVSESTDSSAQAPVLQTLTEATELNTAANVANWQSTTALTLAGQEHVAMLQAAQLLHEAQKDPIDQHAESIGRLTKMYGSGLISARTYQSAMVRANATVANSFGTMASSAANAVGSLFQENKDVATATALINTFTAITQALASAPYPFSLGLAAAAAAKGYAQVQAIRSTSKGGGGGSRSAGGGGGGGASNVTSTRQGPVAPTGQPGTGGGQVLRVEGLSGDQLFTGDAVETLATQLLEYQRNGGRVVIGQ